MDFGNELKKQLNFVITSCRAYDDGIRDEAIRIAVAARVLFHDTANSRSLVRSHLNLRTLKMRSTCADLKAPNPHFLGFIGVDPSMGQFRPYLDKVVRDEQTNIETWWEKEPIMKLLKGDETITRKQLILAAANKDGGAHIDPKVPDEYERLDAGVGIQLKVKLASGVQKLVTLRFANLAALRQIGHEILTSQELVKGLATKAGC